MLQNVPQLQKSNVVSFNCFIQNNECLALHIWKINLTNEYRLSKRNSVGLQLETSSSRQC